MLEREGERMVEKFGFDKQEKQLDFSMQRMQAANQAVDDAAATQDKMMSAAFSQGASLLMGG